MSNENQRTYWKSLNELAQNEEFVKASEREFPKEASELKDGLSRRNFIQIMGASVALAGLASCRKPVQKILPLRQQPEHMVPGNPLYYATSMPFKDSVYGLIVETREGRPIKIEGNPEHPSTLGSTNVFQQAATLELYDRDRSRHILQGDQQASREEFEAFCAEQFADTDQRIAFISEDSSSPTYLRLKQAVLDRFPNAEWVNHEPFSDENRLLGNEKAFGQKLRTYHHFDQAKVILSLDEDFMQLSDNDVENVKRFSEARRVKSTEDDMNRLYSVESAFTLTGSNADHRLRVKAAQIPLFLNALAARLSESVDGLEAYRNHTNEFSQHAWISVLAEELLNNRGESIVAAGMDHDSDVHATVAAINLALGNAGTTIAYLELPHVEAGDQNQRFAEVTRRLGAGEFQSVVIMGTNPVFTAPSDLNFAEALDAVPVSINLSNHVGETARLCDWHVNKTHFLEAWGDGYSYNGVRSIIQPMIQPLFGALSEVEFLNMVLNGEYTTGYDLVRETWQSFAPQDFEDTWATVLHDGLQEGTSFPAVSVSLANGFTEEAGQVLGQSTPVDEEALELVMKVDSRVYDGRFANNGWLQELPDSITKITWDNVAQISAATARRIGIPDERDFGDLDAHKIRITAGDQTVEIPAWVIPGQADNSITVTYGYGREGFGRVADGVGTDIYPLRTTENLLFHSDVQVERTGEQYAIASTQDHSSMEGRALVREASIEEYRDHPTFAPDMVYIPGEVDEKSISRYTLFDPQDYPENEPQWGMSIDLNTCIGCHACTIACQAENNIPVIGKREVHREREMHWIRVDRYFSGPDEANPQVLHQPVPCMHCELAPCEQVCPVAATTHSDDGLNQMTYNRCIGTRYCANNCPYKVRRFNFFNYTKEYLTTGEDPEVVQMAMNPDVTIRFRGVMEKCTYCVQRIQRGKIETKRETDLKKPADGTVKTACQQACPANAIDFGDLTDTDSQISQIKRNERSYLMLGELNTRPRTSYVAKLRNPNPDMA
ncbi:MAG: TAT-variant-translocated molybdopterin oxidoreductase [Balneolales bacterium]